MGDDEPGGRDSMVAAEPLRLRLPVRETPLIAMGLTLAVGAGGARTPTSTSLGDSDAPSSSDSSLELDK